MKSRDPYSCPEYRTQTRWQSFVLCAAALACLCVIPLSAAHAETVLTRQRIGNNSSGITYVTSGHWKNLAVVADGNDVLAVNLGIPGHESLDAIESNGSNGTLRGPGWKKIFDVLALGPNSRAPNGMVFVPGENKFVFSGSPTSDLFVTDEFGRPLAPIVLSGLANPTDFSNYEGLTWIPRNAPKHPNTIAALMIRASDFIAHVIYIRLDGTVEAEVLPQPGTPIEAYICGIAYQPQRPGTLLLSECGSGNYAMDEDGNFLGGILPAPGGSGDIENILVDRFGRVFLGSYDGHLYAYDTNYNRLPTSQDRSYVIGLGIPAASVTWDSDTQRLIFLNFNTNAIEAVPLSLRSKHTLFNIDPVRASFPWSISYLGGGQLAIANRSFPRGIQVVNLPDGSEVERLVFLPPTYPNGAFVPVGAGAFGSDQFIVRVVGDRGALRIVSRTGTPDSSILPNATLPTRFPDLTLSSFLVGQSVQVFDSGSGPRIFTGGTIFDTSGNLLHTVDQSALGVTVGLSQGTWIRGNTFAGIDSSTSTVIIFSVP